MVANEGAVGGDAALLKRLVEPLYRAKIWMQLIGIMLILSGLLIALTIVGIVICWIPIWAGIVLMQAAGSIDLAYTDGNSEAAVGAMRRLKTYFTIFGVLILIYFALTVIGMLFGLSAGIMGAAQMGMG